ncbi:MAG TPA: hypothetical protein VF730_05045 [Terracidiphilus sp.]
MPGDPVVLDMLGGLVATARPEDIPEGASPRCYDVDFVVGRFTQRPGLSSVYTNVLTEFGPNPPTTATDVDTESMPWTNPTNILLNDGSFATVALLGNVGVGSVTMIQGGYYALSETPAVAFSGTGSGATGTCVTATITPPSGPQYKVVTGVTVTASGSYTGTITATFSGSANPTNDATGTVVNTGVGQTSDNIRCLGFGFELPANYQVKGIGVKPKGFASNGTIYAQMVKSGALIGTIQSVALPTSNGFVMLGGPADVWDTTWTPTDANSPNFGVEVWCTAPDAETISLDYIEIILYSTPVNANYNGIVAAKLNQAEQITLALDANGLTWKEDVTNAPNTLALESDIPYVPAGSIMKGLDANGVAYMAYSDSKEGTAQPMQYNGSWCDRITQVGPGAAPVFTPRQSTSDTFPILEITQPSQMSDPEDPGHFQSLMWSAGPFSTAPGNVITISYKRLTPSGPNVPDTDLVNAFNSKQPTYVYMSNLPAPFVDGTYPVTDVGQSIPPGAEYARYYFTYQVASSQYVFIGGPDTGTGFYQRTLATMQTQAPVPGLAVGDQITINNNSITGYNSTWSITQALDSGEMQITSTSVTAGVATYNYVLLTGTAPAAGELVTVTNTTNAGGALNVANVTIVSASGGSPGNFQVNVPVVTAGPASEPSSAHAVTAGTLFTFDPGALTLGSMTSPIFGNNSPISITAWSITSNVVTFTAANSLSAGNSVNLSGFATATFFNGQTVVVLATGLSGTQFEANFTHADGSGTESGTGGTGGTLTFVAASSQIITSGIKKASVFFITRNGDVTRPAPPAIVTIPVNCGAILVSNIPVGPEDVVARGVTFTESGQNGQPGANFYYYDTPYTYIVNGVSFSSGALIVPDNTTTTAVFSFSDEVLLASDEIDIPGNNYFNLIELGNPVWMFQYASRMLYGLCQSKIQNLLNMSFDGGYIPTLSIALPMPLGWSSSGVPTAATYSITGFSISSNIVTIIAVNSLVPGLTVSINGLSVGTYLNGVNLVVDIASGTQFTASFGHADVGSTADTGTATVQDSSVGLVPSLDFGNAFRIQNYSSSAWTDAAVIFQPAYQDYLGVNIIQPNTAYSVRVKARALTADGLTVTVQLPTYANNIFGPTLYGSASFTFNQGVYVTQTAPLITGNGLATVPSALQIALGISALPIGDGVEVDRIEVFPTNNPTDTTIVWTSYAGKFGSVDIVSGQLGVGAENAQPATGAFELLEQLYIEKTASLQVTQDSPNYEPYNWQVRQASDRCGAVGPNAFDEGEEFTLSASRNGIYFFDGGKPMPIMRELQSTGVNLNLWETVNWAAGSTIWIRNDLNNRRLLIGLPMVTPNFWLPHAAAVTPTSPNVILMCNYTGCPTGEELAASSEVHITMFGDLKALDMRRKWSIWQIACPAAEFVPRQDGLSDPLFLCNGIASSKIYQLLPGAATAGQNTDDGAAINWLYTTYGFVKAKQGQQNPVLGALRKVWYYLAATMEGIGKVSAKLYSNSLGALPRNTFTIPLQFTLSSPQQNDQERVLEIGGQRVFVEFTSVGSGGYAEVGPVMLDGEMDKNAPHRGVSS